jgi:hypothetical protein
MGRVSTFADKAVIKMATDQFIPVCTDDWYTRRRQDAEGEFFRKMADASGRTGEGGSTRQGIYVFTADGTPLGFKNGGHDAEFMKGVFRDALKKFQRLPANQRKPGAVEIPEPGKLDAKYTRTIPADGLVARVNTRVLETKGTELSAGTSTTKGGDKASRDFLWLTKKEATSFVPPDAKLGQTIPVPEPIINRISRFHLLDNTRGEPEFWKKDQVRKTAMTLTVTAATKETISLQLDGAILLSTDADLNKAERGYDLKLHGELRYSLKTERFEQFDLAAIGQHWGEQAYAGKARSGKTQLGVVFTLADVTKPGSTISPQGIRSELSYWGQE